MELNAINTALQRRIGSNHRITITNGQPGKVLISGQPQSYYALQQALEVIKQKCPGVSVEITSALAHLKNRELIKPNSLSGMDSTLLGSSENWI